MREGELIEALCTVYGYLYSALSIPASLYEPSYKETPREAAVSALAAKGNSCPYPTPSLPLVAGW